MATITYINNGNTNGSRVLHAVRQIRQGLATLQELDGMRLEAIGAGQSVMASVFGIDSNANAQAVSDRWGALLAAFEDTGNSEYSKLRDLLNATIENPA